MKKEYDVLFTPCKIGNLEIKNRFVVPARKKLLFYTIKAAKAVTPEHEKFRYEVPGEPEGREFRMFRRGRE